MPTQVPTADQLPLAASRGFSLVANPPMERTAKSLKARFSDKEDLMGWRSKSAKRAAAGDEIENILGRTSLFRGDLTADGAFRIDGWIEGSVDSRGTVIIGEGGAVHGNVRGTDIVVAGQIVGNVVCSGHLEILANGRIEGDIDAQSVRIETGGIFRGTSHMGAQASARASLEARTEPASEAKLDAGSEVRSEVRSEVSSQASTSMAATGEVPPYETELSSAA
jgi:cytoskeletal protein CcmA (bactofilin family)